MDNIIGKDKFPLFCFEENKYTHIFPVTKYQFERYICETAPDVDYDEIIIRNPRISPKEVSRENLKQLFMTSLTFMEAYNFASWLGGRLPLRSEFESIYNHFSGIKVIDIVNEVKTKKDTLMIDSRYLTILNIFSEKKLQELVSLANIRELCSETGQEPFRPIYTCSRALKNTLISDPGMDRQIDRIKRGDRFARIGRIPFVQFLVKKAVDVLFQYHGRTTEDISWSFVHLVGDNACNSMVENTAFRVVLVK